MKRIFRGLVTALVWLGIWYAVAYFVDADYLFPMPHRVLGTLFTLALKSDFWLSAGMSLLNVFSGLALGTLLGVVFAVLSAMSEQLHTFLSPLSSVIKATPVASFILIALVMLDKAMVPSFIATLIVIPSVWKSVATGIRETDRELLEMSGAFRMNRLNVLRFVYLPSVMPHFRSAVLTSAGMAWKAGIAAEVICSPKGTIGYFLYRSKIYFETPELFARTLTVILLSMILERLISFLLSAKRRRKIPGHFGKATYIKSEKDDIVAEGIKKEFEEKNVLDGFSYNFKYGENYAIMGASGVGKSTLWRILSGLDTPTSGKIQVPKGKISFVFQENRLLEGTCLMNILALGVEKAEALGYLDLVGLAGEEETRVSELSGGMARRLSLARALAFGGDVFMMDEPFSGLDEATAGDMAELIRRETEGKLLICVTHNRNCAEILGANIVNIDKTQ